MDGRMDRRTKQAVESRSKRLKSFESFEQECMIWSQNLVLLNGKPELMLELQVVVISQWWPSFSVLVEQIVPFVVTMSTNQRS